MPNLNETIAALRARNAAHARQAPAVKMREVPDFGANPGNLRALLYTPPRLPKRAPLVVVLHGCTQAAEAYAASAGWLALADRHGFAVLSPEQAAANNPNLCFNWFQPADVQRGSGEVESIAQMVRRVVAAEALDPGRVYISGLSAGGAMSAAVLASYPELFAGGAIIAGLPYGAADNLPKALQAMAQIPMRSAEDWGSQVRGASRHSGPWPRVSIWHGDADVTVRPDAGEALARQWANVHGIEQAAPERIEQPGRTSTRWSSAGQVLVEHHRVQAMGHGTPLRASGADACGSAAPFMLDVGICSSTESLAFWGVINSAEPVQQRASPSEGAADRPRRQAPLGRDVGAVITAALRSAGLLK